MPGFVLKFVPVVVGHLLDGLLRIPVELLDVIESPTSVNEERPGGHRPNAIDARKLPQNLVILVFEDSFCVVFVSCRVKSTFEILTSFTDSAVLEVFPYLLKR